MASMEAEMKEQTRQLERLQSQLKLLEASQNKEQNHNSEVTFCFLRCVNVSNRINGLKFVKHYVNYEIYGCEVICMFNIYRL